MVGTQTAPNSLHSSTAFNISMFSEMLQSMMPDVCTTMHMYMCKTKSSVFFSRFRTSGPSGAQQFETWPSGYLKDHWSPTNKQRSRLALWIIPPNNGLTTAPCFKAWPDTTWVSGTPRDAPQTPQGALLLLWNLGSAKVSTVFQKLILLRWAISSQRLKILRTIPHYVRTKFVREGAIWSKILELVPTVAIAPHWYCALKRVEWQRMF